MKPVHAVAFVVAGLAGVYLFKRTPLGAKLKAATMTPGTGFVGPLPAASGVVGSKPAAAVVGPLPFRGPPAPDETVRVDYGWLETPYAHPL